MFFSDIAKDIIELAVHGKAQNESYNRLANFTDKFGPRLAGSQALEDAIGKTVGNMQIALRENRYFGHMQTAKAQISLRIRAF